MIRALTLLLLAGSLLEAQPRAPGKKPPSRSFKTQGSSTVAFADGPEGQQSLEITNVAFELTGNGVPGRPPMQRLLLRKTTLSKEVLGDKGIEATTTLEAWPFPANLQAKPIYTVKVSGANGETADHAVFVAARGLDETDWWSVYKLGSGEHLFDTYVPLVRFSISRENFTLRYAGLEIPPSDTPDVRLKDPRVIGVVTYAAPDRVLREALLTCDDPSQAALLRSYEDTTRTLRYADGALEVTFSENFPSRPNTFAFQIAVVHDALDLTRVKLPANLHLSPWKR